MSGIVSFDYSALTNYYNARINLNLARSLPTSDFSQTAGATDTGEVDASELPWRQEIDQAAALISALGAQSFLAESVADDARSEDGDVPKLLAAYEALAQVKVIADAALAGDLPGGQESRSFKRVLEGIDEVTDFLKSVDITKSTLISGERVSTAQSDVALARSTYEYNTKALHSGDFDAEVDAFTGDKTFSIEIKKINTTSSIDIDLSEMEATTGQTVRNLDNVAEFINFKLEEAGALTRFERVKIGTEDEDGEIEGDSFGFKLKGTSVETLSFSATDAAPAAVMVGSSGSSGDSGGQLSVWTGLDGAEPTRAMATRLDATVDEERDDDIDAKFNAVAEHPDGGYIVVGSTNGQVGDNVTRGESDAFMSRYDSQGNMLWSRAMGAGTNAEGLALSVSDTGQIAITGKTSDDLISDAIGGGDDSFVTLYDADGIEQWTQQRAATFNDQGNAIAFTSDGGVIIGGTTSGSLNDTALAGGSDAFIQKLDADGNQEWTRQFGTNENDRLSALTIASDGSIIAAGIENGEAVVRRYAGETDDAADWTFSLGDLNTGSIQDIEVADDGSVYIAGATRMSGEDANGFTGDTQTDRDGFVAKLDVSSGTPSVDWIQRLGGEGYQTANSVKLHGDQVIVAGTGEAEFGSGTSDKAQSAYLTTLNQSDGAQGWTSSVSGRGGIAEATDVIISTGTSSTLNDFGLPDGDLVISDSSALTDRLPLRAGDHFYVSVDGGSDKKITIEQGDNLRALTFKINSALVLDGNADVRRGTDGQSLRISPADGTQIELKAGADGQDALSVLGLAAGFVMEKPIGNDDSENVGPEIVTLGLTTDISFDDEDSMQDAVDMLDGALRGLRTAYRWAIDDPTLLQLQNGNDGPGTNADGTPPAYLTAQIANLQAGLARLSAGSGGGLNLFA